MIEKKELLKSDAVDQMKKVSLYSSRQRITLNMNRNRKSVTLSLPLSPLELEKKVEGGGGIYSYTIITLK